MADYNIILQEIEPENLLTDIKDVKTKLNIVFPKNEDNVFLLKSIILEQHNRISELERTVKILKDKIL